MVATPLSPPNRDPVADARQVFQGNPAPHALGLRHQRFRNAVSFMGRKPLCLAAAVFQGPLGRFCALLLPALAKFRMTLAQAIDRRPRVGLAVGGGSSTSTTTAREN